MFRHPSEAQISGFQPPASGPGIPRIKNVNIAHGSITINNTISSPDNIIKHRTNRRITDRTDNRTDSRTIKFGGHCYE